jgi:hypothetical protein
MSRGPAVVAALGLTVVVALGPLAALASPGRGGPRNGPGVSGGGRLSGGAPRGSWTGFHGGVPRHASPQHDHGSKPHAVPPPHTIFPKPSQGFRHGHGFKQFPCCGVITWGAPLYYGGYAYNGAPAYYYPPPTYYVYAPQWYTYAPAYTPPIPSPPPPPDTDATTLAPEATSQVIQYPSGRYELRGDGRSVPYTWVWVPNPPPPPPEPPAEPPANAPASSSPPASRRTPVYRWTDEQGVTHWTDHLDSVPARHRTEAMQTGSP